jgi:hypothetical protein
MHKIAKKQGKTENFVSLRLSGEMKILKKVACSVLFLKRRVYI